MHHTGPIVSQTWSQFGMEQPFAPFQTAGGHVSEAFGCESPTQIVPPSADCDPKQAAALELWNDGKLLPLEQRDLESNGWSRRSKFR